MQGGRSFGLFVLANAGKSARMCGQRSKENEGEDEIRSDGPRQRSGKNEVYIQNVIGNPNIM